VRYGSNYNVGNTHPTPYERLRAKTYVCELNVRGPIELQLLRAHRLL